MLQCLPTAPQRRLIVAAFGDADVAIWHHPRRNVSDRGGGLPPSTGTRDDRVHLRRARHLRNLPVGLLVGRGCQHRHVLVPEAGGLRHPAEGHRRPARQELVGAANGSRPPGGHPLHRGRAEGEGLDGWQGCHPVRRARLADICLRRGLGALRLGVRAGDDSNHRFRAPLRADRLPVHQEGRGPDLVERRQPDDRGRCSGQLALVGHCLLGYSEPPGGGL
mmetsp:Transcript_58911/g.172442  ORF Transcript_58911/g.172442 Transcript_58911/m.172442 type:complete len:220 (-) Transcript_58911:751-1410(-)